MRLTLFIQAYKHETSTDCRYSNLMVWLLWTFYFNNGPLYECNWLSSLLFSERNFANCVNCSLAFLSCPREFPLATRFWSHDDKVFERSKTTLSVTKKAWMVFPCPLLYSTKANFFQDPLRRLSAILWYMACANLIYQQIVVYQLPITKWSAWSFLNLHVSFVLTLRGLRSSLKVEEVAVTK